MDAPTQTAETAIAEKAETTEPPGATKVTRTTKAAGTTGATRTAAQKPVRKPRKKASPPVSTEGASKASEASQAPEAPEASEATRAPEAPETPEASEASETKPVADVTSGEESAAAEEPSAQVSEASSVSDVSDAEPVATATPEEEPAAAETASDAQEQAEAAAPEEESHERTIESVRADETPIFAAMFSGWDGPAAGMIGRNLHRADDDTMVFDLLMWRPSPDEAAPALRFQVGGDRHAPVVTVNGELNSGSVALLTTPLRHILRRRPRQLVVDLAGITAASPAALRALLDVRGAARAAHVDFWLRSPSEPVRELLQPAKSQVAVRPKSPAARRSPGTIRKRDEADEQVGVNGAGGVKGVDGEEPDAGPSSSQSTTHLKAHPVAARFSVIHRRPSTESTVLEGVVVQGQGPVTRSRPWWSSHSLRESLRRVGSHQHAHGHGSPT